MVEFCFLCMHVTLHHITLHFEQFICRAILQEPSYIAYEFLVLCRILLCCVVLCCVVLCCVVLCCVVLCCVVLCCVVLCCVVLCCVVLCCVVLCCVVLCCVVLCCVVLCCVVLRCSFFLYCICVVLDPLFGHYFGPKARGKQQRKITLGPRGPVCVHNTSFQSILRPVFGPGGYGWGGGGRKRPVPCRVVPCRAVPLGGGGVQGFVPRRP